MKGIVIIIAATLLVGCGGGAGQSGNAGENSIAVANASTIAGQWEFQATSASNPGNVSVVETNLYVTNAGALDSSGFVILGGQQQGSQVELSSFGDECQPVGSPYSPDQGYITIAQKDGSLQFTLQETGANGTLYANGTIAFSTNGTQVTSGSYSIAAGCGYAADSGTVTGLKVNQFAGNYAGQLGGDAVIINITQNVDGGAGGVPSYTLSGTGTDNGTPITFSGDVLGGAFYATISEAGQTITNFGLYDPTGNDFVVYDQNLNYLGQLNSGVNPNSVKAARKFKPKL